MHKDPLCPMTHFAPLSLTMIGKTLRRCQLAWFEKFPWLHYSVEKDSVFCFLCMKAAHMAGLNEESWFSGAEEAFIISGYKNWKKGLEKLTSHGKSQFHLKGVNLVMAGEKGTPISAQLDESARKEQVVARKCMLTIISSLRFLMRSGLAVRGHEEFSGNLMRLLEERKLDVPDLGPWLKRRYSYLSHDIQNELIQMMAHKVLNEILDEIRKSPYFALIADGTTDISGKEQFSVCIRVVAGETLMPEEFFIGLYNPENATGKSLTAAIKDVLIRSMLSLERLCGCCFDGASNMSGREKGVQRLLSDEQPKCLYVHCENHSLDLALQDVAKNVDSMSDLLALVRGCSNIILDSAKRREVYKNIVLPSCAGDEEAGCEHLSNCLPFVPPAGV